jgi:hypothetical protein
LFPVACILKFHQQGTDEPSAGIIGNPSITRLGKECP